VSIFSPTMNGFSRLAFRANIKGSTAGSTSSILAYQSPYDATLVAQTGSSAADAPGVPGAKFKSFGDPVFDELDEMAFSAHLATTSGGVTTANDYGVWSSVEGVLNLALREGDAAPGLDASQHFVSTKWLNLVSNALFIGANTSDGATTTTAVKHTGIWKWNGATLTKVIANGDSVTIGDATHTVKTFSSAASAGTGNATSRLVSANGQVTLLVTCTDGTSGPVTF
jgi:hypothetical protein